MAKAKFYGTGRRKKSVARAYLVPGTGNITINKRDIDEYLGLETLKVVVRQPLTATDNTEKFDVLVNVHGGGFTGTGGSDDNQLLAFFYFQIYIFQYLEISEILTYIFQSDHFAPPFCVPGRNLCNRKRRFYRFGKNAFVLWVIS